MFEEVDVANRTMRRLRRRRARVGPEIQPIPLAELDHLELPMRVPGDQPARRPDRPTFGMTWWRPDGTPMGMHEYVAQEAGTMLRDARARTVARSTLWRGGVRLTISTVFLGIDHSWMEHGDPVLWETMVFHAHRRCRGFGDGCQQWRYASRLAALHGHRQVAAAIEGTNRIRAALWRANPRTAPLGVARVAAA